MNKPNQQKRLKQIVATINEQNPDLVVSTGDYVSGHTQESTMHPKEIAEELFVTESTIKKHTSSIFAKFNVTNRYELYAKLKKYI